MYSMQLTCDSETIESIPIIYVYMQYMIKITEQHIYQYFINYRKFNNNNE